MVKSLLLFNNDKKEMFINLLVLVILSGRDGGELGISLKP
jgi:hypothetical protein